MTSLLAGIYKIVLRQEDRKKYFIPMQLHVLGKVVEIGGWISAFGGAWKDAPSEGFQTLRFFRSPALASLMAMGLAGLTESLLLVTLAATGYTIAMTETCKTFFFPSTPRGKFAGMPIRFSEMLRRRRRFVPLHVAIWAGVLAAIAGATHG
jgi:hypothetical protein